MCDFQFTRFKRKLTINEDKILTLETPLRSRSKHHQHVFTKQGTTKDA